MWVWKEQQHEFQLAAPAGSISQAQGQQQQQQGQQGELWHIAKGHLQHDQAEQPGKQQQQLEPQPCEQQ